MFSKENQAFIYAILALILGLGGPADARIIAEITKGTRRAAESALLRWPFLS